MLSLSSLVWLSIGLDTASAFTSILLFISCSTGCLISSSPTILASILSPSHSLIGILGVNSWTSVWRTLPLSSLVWLSIELDTTSAFTSILSFISCSTSCLIFFSMTIRASILSPSHSLIGTLEVESWTSISHMLSLSSLVWLSIGLDTASAFTSILLFISCSTGCFISPSPITFVSILSQSYLLIGILGVTLSISVSHMLSLSSLVWLSIELDMTSTFTPILSFTSYSSGCFISSSPTTIVSTLPPSHSLIGILDATLSVSISHMLSLFSLVRQFIESDTTSAFTSTLLFTSCSKSCFMLITLLWGFAHPFVRPSHNLNMLFSFSFFSSVLLVSRFFQWLSNLLPPWTIFSFWSLLSLSSSHLAVDLIHLLITWSWSKLYFSFSSMFSLLSLILGSTVFSS